MRRPGSWWRGKSTPAKVETYTRSSFLIYPLVEIGSFGIPALRQLPSPLSWVLFLLVVGHAALGGVTGSRTLDWTRDTRARPKRLLWVFAAVTAALAVLSIVLSIRGPKGEEAQAAGAVFVGVLAIGTGTLALAVREHRRIAYGVLGVALGSGTVALLVGAPALAAAVTFGGVLLAAGFFSFASAFSVWLLDAVYELDEARETRARLAVAEERLRFGRDLHDVMGRNLAVIALKSELAVQLARRERPEALEQMIEVQRIAQESQKEVREVVRGYREADLAAELAGAQGVLTAAGIDCTVTGSVAVLPTAVQSALGWAVREATTNVLRHGDAERCAVSLRAADGQVVLTVENDGAPPNSPTGSRTGSGLAGLRERLSAVDGTLEAGPSEGGMFRVVAKVSLPSASSSASQSSSSAASASSSSSSSSSTVPRPVGERAAS
ncbi:sensor histidine kinase [Streptomyces sporangiiformans]|uniref:Sensor histidine kinase n=1 Tax=Streptomyces sporangiiformans TaxID=2315329 RepID=A0A505DN04_9ACTN|nr:sensor histidine kinase [Streptomyces sporangiiformans]TPQ21161.1 sensor histidine kinase [Streptomyces sporangiiformans]